MSSGSVDLSKAAKRASTLRKSIRLLRTSIQRREEQLVLLAQELVELTLLQLPFERRPTTPELGNTDCDNFIGACIYQQGTKHCVFCARER